MTFRQELDSIQHMPASTPSKEQLQRAIEIQEQITKLELEMREVLSGTTPTKGSQVNGSRPAKRKPRKKLSPESRAKMAAAAKKRWAKKKPKK